MAAPKNWVYITGCDSGFGSVAVKLLVAKGFGVFASHMLPQSADVLKAVHANVVPVLVDITKQESVDAAARQVKDNITLRGGQLYGLINNAGLMLGTGPVEWTPASTYEKMFAVNIIGPVRVTNSVLPLLRQSRGRIVNVASLAGVVALPSQTAYSASKYAVEGWSDGLRRELWDWGISVHIIEPGVFKTTGLYSTYADGVQKLWDAQPAHIQQDYGTEFKDKYSKVSNMALTLGSKDTSLVPKAMIQALTAKRPKYRYRVGPDAIAVIHMMKWMHESWQDWVFRLNPYGRMVPAACDINAYRSATRRYRGTGMIKSIFYALMLYFILKIRRSL